MNLHQKLSAFPISTVDMPCNPLRRFLICAGKDGWEREAPRFEGCPCEHATEVFSRGTSFPWSEFSIPCGPSGMRVKPDLLSSPDFGGPQLFEQQLLE